MPIKYTVGYQFVLLRWQRFVTGERVVIGLLCTVPSEDRYFLYTDFNTERLENLWTDFNETFYYAALQSVRESVSTILTEGGVNLGPHLKEDGLLHRYDNNPWGWSHIMSGITQGDPEDRFEELKVEFIDRHHEAQ
jgi:hypothetical protein